MGRPRVLDHPSRTYYMQGCRCDGCVAANNAYMARWRARRVAAGTHRLLHGRWVPIDESLTVTPPAVISVT